MTFSCFLFLIVLWVNYHRRSPYSSGCVLNNALNTVFIHKAGLGSESLGLSLVPGAPV